MGARRVGGRVEQRRCAGRIPGRGSQLRSRDPDPGRSRTAGGAVAQDRFGLLRKARGEQRRRLTREGLTRRDVVAREAGRVVGRAVPAVGDVECVLVEGLPAAQQGDLAQQTGDHPPSGGVTRVGDRVGEVLELCRDDGARPGGPQRPVQAGVCDELRPQRLDRVVVHGSRAGDRGAQPRRSRAFLLVPGLRRREVRPFEQLGEQGERRGVRRHAAVLPARELRPQAGG
ncbi:hypothetical protein ACFQV8_28605 [Pseudonocardia benzenivorans]